MTFPSLVMKISLVFNTLGSKLANGTAMNKLLRIYQDNEGIAGGGGPKTFRRKICRGVIKGAKVNAWIVQLIL